MPNACTGLGNTCSTSNIPLILELGEKSRPDQSHDDKNIDFNSNKHIPFSPHQMNIIAITNVLMLHVNCSILFLLHDVRYLVNF